MLKKSIRQSYLKKRAAFTTVQRQELNELMVGHFSKLNLPSVNYLFSYYALLDKAEFDVEPCAHRLKELNSNMVVSWPRIDTKHHTMEALPLSESVFFSKNKYNILEPLSGDPIPPENQDIIFVPLIAFDKNGYRVGYGKGYYDRYLTRCRTDCLRIGFSFFEPLEAISDIGEFDVPLSVCITPSRIYEF